MSSRLAFSLIIFGFSLGASANIPSRYTELLDFVQVAPDQGESNTCLYVGSTGAMELIANKKANIRNPLPYGTFDLSEAFLIHAPHYDYKGRNFLEIPVRRFNRGGFGIHLSEWDYTAWEGNQQNNVWVRRNWSGMEKTALPKVETIPLFMKGNRWSTRILNDQHIQTIKEALWKYKSPILVNYNDEGYWHVVLIIGYDDDLPGSCYDEDTDPAECNDDTGSFYIRDSFGIPVEVRDYDWFRIKGNAAIVVKEV